MKEGKKTIKLLIAGIFLLILVVSDILRAIFAEIKWGVYSKALLPLSTPFSIFTSLLVMIDILLYAIIISGAIGCFTKTHYRRAIAASIIVIITGMFGEPYETILSTIFGFISLGLIIYSKKEFT